MAKGFLFNSSRITDHRLRVAKAMYEQAGISDIDFDPRKAWLTSQISTEIPRPADAPFIVLVHATDAPVDEFLGVTAWQDWWFAVFYSAGASPRKTKISPTKGSSALESFP